MTALFVDLALCRTIVDIVLYNEKSHLIQYMYSFYFAVGPLKECFHIQPSPNLNRNFFLQTMHISICVEYSEEYQLN